METMFNPREEFYQIKIRFEELQAMADSLLKFVKGEGRLPSTRLYFIQAKIYVDHVERVFNRVKEFAEKFPMSKEKKEVEERVEKVFALCEEFREVQKRTPVGMIPKCRKVDRLAMLTRMIIHEGILAYDESFRMGRDKPAPPPADPHFEVIDTLNMIFVLKPIHAFFNEHPYFFSSGQKALMAYRNYFKNTFSKEYLPQHAAEAALKVLQNRRGLSDENYRFACMEAFDCLLSFTEYHQLLEKDKHKESFTREPKVEDFPWLMKFSTCKLRLIPQRAVYFIEDFVHEIFHEK